MNQMAKGLLFGAAVLSQAAAGCFPAAAASIDRVRIRLAAEELDEMECLLWRRKAGTGHIASLVWNESPVIRQADRRWMGQRWEKKKMNNIKGAYKPTLKI